MNQDLTWAKQAVDAMLKRVQAMVVAECLRKSSEYLGIAHSIRKPKR